MLDLDFSLIFCHQILLVLLPRCRVVRDSSSIALFPSTCEIQGWSCFGFVFHMELLPLHHPSRPLYRTLRSRHTHDTLPYHASCPSASSACSPSPPDTGRHCRIRLRSGYRTSRSDGSCRYESIILDPRMQSGTAINCASTKSPCLTIALGDVPRHVIGRSFARLTQCVAARSHASALNSSVPCRTALTYIPNQRLDLPLDGVLMMAMGAAGLVLYVAPVAEHFEVAC